jgi:tetratricopeptide (TPR) repeat protein
MPGPIIALAVWFVYAPVVHGTFVWDDELEILGNAVLRDPAGLAKIWSGNAGPDYFPLKSTVQWLAWRIWGQDPTGFHLLNIGLHLASALLVWAVLRKLGVRHGWVGGLLFAVHPVAVESAAWISELKNTLSLPLLLLSILCFLGRPSGRPATALSLGFFLLAMLAKSSVVMLPPTLLLYAWYRNGRIGWADLRSTAPFFAIALSLGLVTLYFQTHRAMAPLAALPLQGAGPRMACAGLSAAFYVGHVLAPVVLLPIYPRWDVADPSALQFLPWPGFAALILWLWTRRRTWGRPVLLGLGFFLLNLAPVLGFLPMSYQAVSWVADHFAYVSLVGAAGLAAAGFAALEARLSGSGRRWLWAAAGIVLAGLAVESRGYAGKFSDPEKLWSYTISVAPDNVPALNNLGVVYYNERRNAESIAVFQKALRIDPDYGDGHTDLGGEYLIEGRLPEAIAEFRKAAKLEPGVALTHFNLGNALDQYGQIPEAIAQYEWAIAIQPDYVVAHINLGVLYGRTGRLDEAIVQFQAALRVQPDNAMARTDLDYTLRLRQSGRPPGP